MRIRLTPIVAAALLAAAVFAPALAQAPPPAPEKPKLGWADQGELAWTLTAGNADSSSISLANTLLYRWSEAQLKLYAFGIRAKTDETLYFGIDTDPDDSANWNVLSSEKFSRTVAERYVLAIDYEGNISPRMYWFAGTGWERNPPSGIDSRLLVSGGIGNNWYENDRGHFKTSYGLNYTWESWTNGDSDDYLGGNVTANWLWKFNASTSFQTVDTLFLNFFTGSDWRINSNNALTVQMNKMLALKVGLTFLYDNDPQSVQYPVYGQGGNQVGNTNPIELDKLDTIFTTSLVVGF